MAMRLERHGGPPDLQAAIKALVLHRLHGRAFDDNHAKEASEGQFPDFTCYRDVLLIEMKHLETDQHTRINKILEENIDPTEKPVFYGSREARLVIKQVSNSAVINAAIVSKLSHTTENILSKANKQFRSYRFRYPRKNSVSICVLLNSMLLEYSPDIVIHAIHGKMNLNQSGEPRFPEIDAVIYISEKHFQILPDGRLAFALAIYGGAGAINQPWKVQFIDRVVDAWSCMRTGGPVAEGGNLYGFATVQDIPKSMRRHEAWQLAYQRNPYLRALSDWG
jgi:hypothetical protein